MTTTINRSLEIVRTILNRAPRSYGNADGHPWLEAMPPLIKVRVPCGSLVRRSCLVIFLIDRGYAQDAVIKYSREYYRDRALERANPLIIWLPE